MKYFALALLFLTACKQPAPVKDVPAAGQLVHMLFFQLKPEADKQAFLRSLQTFQSIEVVRHLEIGHFQDTGGPPSELSAHSIVVRLTFDDLAAFRVYEKHPVHLASIEATKGMLAGPPTGYDYVVE